jgi:hypothetical protein
MGMKAARIDTAELKIWLSRVQRLLSQIEGWAKQREWEIRQEEKAIAEDTTGSYLVPVLQIKLPAGVLYVEPVARYVIGAEGRVDLYSWPTLQRLLLIRRDDKWVLKTDSLIDWPQTWSRKTFYELAENLTKAA